jgi:protein O-mannosyl-transferase
MVMRVADAMRTTIVAFFLAVLTAAVFWPAAGHDFVDFDDTDFVAANPFIQQGLTRQGVEWAFAAPRFNYWIPLTWISYMVDTEIGGAGPRGYHRTNILLHAANAALLFLVMARMTGQVWPSLLVAALFAVHPLRVENVAWIADRKDLLSALFWILGMGAYARYTRQPSVARMAIVALCMILGSLSKQVLVTFPLALLLLDLWPLRRTDWRRALVEKTPLYLVAIGFAALAYATHQHEGIAKGFDTFPLGNRVLQVPLNYLAYLRMTVWPAKLCAMYPMAMSARAAAALLAGAVLFLATGLVLASRRLPVIVGWLWFGLLLAPVIGLVKIGHTDVADRFMYLPSIGLFIIVVWLAQELLPWRRAAAVAGLVAVVALAGATRAQLPHWQDGEALSRRALAVTMDNFLAWNSLGRALERKGDLPGALTCYAKSLSIAPWFTQAHVNAGNALAGLNRPAEALPHFEQVLDVDPGNARTRSNYGTILYRTGRNADGIAQLRQAVQRDPTLADAQFNLGAALAMEGRKQEALEAFRVAGRINPSDTLARRYAEELEREGRVGLPHSSLGVPFSDTPMR